MQDNQYLTVSNFIEITNSALKRFGEAIILGEISEISMYSHLYFKIKDESSVLDCLMFASALRVLPFKVSVGQKVIVRGSSNIYNKNGSFKFIVQSMTLAGQGMIMEQLRLLKEKLEREGIFSLNKRALPKFIDTVGIITSNEGRVIHDIETTVRSRNSVVKLVLYKAMVQGEMASASLIEALEKANQENICDVLIIGRGGGSFEDLLPFSDEALVRAVAHSKIPIISAVGHEPDVVLTDFAADLRAATPTAAAVYVTPVTDDDLTNAFNTLTERMDNAILKHLDLLSMILDKKSAELRALSPSHKIDYYLQTLNSRLLSLTQAIDKQIYQKERYIDYLSSRIIQKSPENKILGEENRLYIIAQKLSDAIDNKIKVKEQELVTSYNAINNSINYYFDKGIDFIINAERRIDRVNVPLMIEKKFYILNNLVKRQEKSIDLMITQKDVKFDSEIKLLTTLNPLTTLKRGYSVTVGPDKKALSAKKAKVGDSIVTYLKDGNVVSTVTEVKKDENKRLIKNSNTNKDRH